jgi:L-threonylcarbamoyladenylate synthase
MTTEIGTDIEKAIAHLKAGNLVAIPTETVYGLAASALNEQAVANIFKTKNRPFFDPLIVHVADLASAKKYVKEMPAEAELLFNTFSPGPLTILLPKNNTISDLVTAASPLVAIRIPRHPLTLQLLTMLDFPLAAPSANPFGYVSPTTASHVFDNLGGKIPFILDGGACEVGLESTIVGIENGKWKLYRQGGIPQEEIECITGPLGTPEKSPQKEAPGMLDSHYSPKKPLLLGDLTSLAHFNKGKRIGFLTFNEPPPSAFREQVCLILSPNSNLHEAANKLFASLRLLDLSDVDVIVAELVPDEGLGRAINDRLKRASVKRPPFDPASEEESAKIPTRN